MKLNNLMRTYLVSIWVLAVLSLGAFTAQAAGTTFEIEPQDLSGALKAFAVQSHREIFFAPELARGRKSNGVKGTFDDLKALNIILEGTGLDFLVTSSNAILVRNPTTKSEPLRQGGVPTTSATGGDDDPSMKLAQADSAQDQNVGNAAALDSKSKREEKDELSEIVVTGTHIRGVQVIESPTLTISREDIDRTGYQTMEQLVSTLPQNFNGLTMTNQYGPGNNALVAQNIDNATAIDLRGLGPQSTLTLVNGQRVAGSIAGRAVDVSLIPLSMVDHVDIVTGGASAIYGADAVGGVANIVLRQSYDGADTQAYFGGTSFGGDRLQASQVLGREYDDAGFMLGYEFARENDFDLVRAHLTETLSPGGAQQLVAPAQPDQHRNSVYLTGHFDPSDWIQLYSDASYARKAQDEYSSTLYPASSFLSGTTVSQTNQEYGVTAGARVKLGASWRLDVTGSTSTYENHYDLLSMYAVAGSASTSQLSVNTRSALNSVSAIADGNLFSAYGIHPKAAVGVDLRREFLSNSQLPLPFDDLTELPHVSRDVAAVFGELNVPVVSNGELPGLRKLDISLAREDHYSDFGSAFDPQAGLVWQPVDTLSFRGNYARAFRAPDLYTVHSGASTDITLYPLATPQNPNPTSVPVLLAAGGNPSIQPERAKTWTSGFDYQIPFTSPAKLSISYFDIKYDERINTPLGNLAVINSALYPSSIVNLHPTPAQVQALANLGPYAGNYSGYPWNGNFQTILAQIPTLILVDDRTLNISEERLRGMDISIDAKEPTPIGEAVFGLNGTRTFTHYQQITPVSPSQDIYNMVGYPVGLRIRADGGLTHGPLGAFLFVNYQGSYTNQYDVPGGRIASWTTFDGTIHFDDSELLSNGPLGNLIMSVSVQNMFDRTPPRFTQGLTGILFDTANANPFGRFISLNIEKRWRWDH